MNINLKTSRSECKICFFGLADLAMKLSNKQRETFIISPASCSKMSPVHLRYRFSPLLIYCNHTSLETCQVKKNL